VLALDPSGIPVLSIDSIKLRPIDQDQIKAARRAEHDALFELAWIELAASPRNRPPLRVALLGDGQVRESQGLELERIPDLETLEQAVEAGRAAPDLVLVQAEKMIDGGEAWTQDGRPAGADGGGAWPQDGELARMVHRLTERMLSLVQAFLGSSWLQESKLVLLTEGALTVAGEEAPNLAQAALPGMMRSAQSEHPGRFALLDVDGSEASLDSLHGALTSEEPQLAIRGGALHAPRLARLKIEHREPAPQLDGEGTVLVSGATGGLGRLLARHLAEHGARHLLLVSRSGEEADGATELKDSLEQLGASVRIAACDVSERRQLQRLISQIPEAHPLTAVIHAAGVLDDGVIESLDPGRLARVMAPKVDGAIHLHELTRALALSHFILFSSAAATLGSPGQGNYAAANAFLDALARYRIAEGLPATSMAWGAWERPTDMTDHLEEADRARFARMGVAPLSDERGLELFDAARGTGLPLLLPMTLDMAALRGAARAGMLPAILRALVRVPARPTSEAGGSLASRLAGVPESEWETVVLDLVKGHVATVLGHASADAVDPRRAFKEAGFDSLGAIELRNRLGQATGVRLPATLVFDHPTPAAVAGYLCSQVAADATRRPAIDVELDRLEDVLSSMTTDGIARERINARLRSLQIKPAEHAQTDDHAITDEMIESATASEIVALLDEELGR
jgi:NAD(P)-dependent dehydrogenase (short-subunit alcohol dehydrogenase family)